MGTGRPGDAEVVEFLGVDEGHPPRLEMALDAGLAFRIIVDVVGAEDFSAVGDVELNVLREDPKGPYVNLIAIRAADKDKPWVKILVDSYHTAEVKEFVLTKFKGAVLPSW